MKDITARTDISGVVLLELEVGELWATINMSTGSVSVSIWDKDNNEFDVTCDVTGEHDPRVSNFEDLTQLRDTMDEWKADEMDFEGVMQARWEYQEELAEANR